MYVHQARLESGTLRRTCYIAAKVKVGDRVTLKDETPGRWWEVISIDTGSVELSTIDMHWNNNI